MSLTHSSPHYPGLSKRERTGLTQAGLTHAGLVGAMCDTDASAALTSSRHFMFRQVSELIPQIPEYTNVAQNQSCTYLRQK